MPAVCPENFEVELDLFSFFPTFLLHLWMPRSTRLLQLNFIPALFRSSFFLPVSNKNFCWNCFHICSTSVNCVWNGFVCWHIHVCKQMGRAQLTYCAYRLFHYICKVVELLFLFWEEGGYLHFCVWWELDMAYGGRGGGFHHTKAGWGVALNTFYSELLVS